MVHQYKLNGYDIVLDTASGSVHLVDDVAYDIIDMYQSRSADEICAEICAKYPEVTRGDVLECLDDVSELEKNRKLFTPDDYEQLAADYKGSSRVIKALCLHVAHTCNLSCAYCFASQGKYHGERALMSFEVGKRALDFLVENSGSRRNLEVDFFGGEPLMNWQVVKDLVAYARSIEKDAGKNFRFTLTTNGVLLDDEVTDFCNREMHNVVLSLDGRPEVNDRFHMADLGFTELSMEPVVCAPDDPCALTEEDFPVLCEQYELLAKEMLRRRREGRPITFYHYMIDLKHGPCIYKRVTGCGSGTEYMAVTPWGELFPCHQFVGDPKYSLGNIWDGVTNAAAQEEFRACNAYSRPDCKDCWARLYCSGGCAANSYHATGSIGGVYEYGCRLFKKRMECAIMLQAASELGDDE